MSSVLKKADKLNISLSMKYVYGFVVLCFVAVIPSIPFDSTDAFTHIIQGCTTGMIVR